MSAILFLGAERALSKTDFAAAEIFSDVKYPDSIFFRDGLTLDGVSQSGEFTGRFRTLCAWYEVKSAATLLAFESKHRDAVPDLYEASVQLGRWFIGFLSAELGGGNRLYLLQRWLGDPPDKKITRGVLRVSDLTPTDCDIPYDVLLELRP